MVPVPHLLACLLAAAGAPGKVSPAEPGQAGRPSPEEARAFIDGVNAELKRLWVRSSTADWIRSTYLTEDTERNAAALNEDVMAYLSTEIHAARRFDGVPVDASTGRMLKLLRLASPLPAPADPARRAELAALSARLEGIYGKGRWCGPASTVRGRGEGGRAPHGGGRCRTIDELERLMATSRSYDALRDAWVGWHDVAREMRPLYRRWVELGDEGAREIGFRDLGELWRSGYDMPPEAFEQDVERLWQQLRPFYEQLHCYVRARLQAVYGKARVPDGRPIPAHLLGNMWAQDWSSLYPLVEPYRGEPSLDVDGSLARQRWSAVRMVKLGEAFFTSLGLPPLPPSFWERSQLTRPRDRDVVCHASAWDVTFSADLRIKMCIRPTEEDLVAIHHELGHNYYQRAYVELPVLFQNGANDGFHEAIGDAIALSVTPGYLKRVGLLPAVPEDPHGVVNVQMKRALEKIAFLPFARLVDQWRWDVFAGRVPPERYEAAWWELRRRYQGVEAPVPRSEEDFDPGAKYHVAAGVPYARYFLAHVYQFQFHRALCRAAGFDGPLHQCSIQGSRAAGARLEAMLALGASRPWPDALEVLTGTRQADASALLEYFAPLRAWLADQTRGLRCGW